MDDPGGGGTLSGTSLEAGAASGDDRGQWLGPSGSRSPRNDPGRTDKREKHKKVQSATATQLDLSLIHI